MKVLVLGLAKSGTTALAYKIHEALGAHAALNFEPGKGAGAEDLELHRELTAAAGPLVTKNLVFPTTETRWDAIFDNAARYDRAVWIARDPRDIIISNFFYHWFGGHKAERAKFEEALARTRRKEDDPGAVPFIDLVAGTMTENRAQLAAWQSSWYDILAGAAEGIASRMIVFRYEDLVDSRFDDLNAALGLALAGETRVPEEHQRVARTRGYGNWRRWFTAEDVEFFRPILSRYLAVMGYDPDDWILEPVDRLPSAEGSGYMEKLYTRRDKPAAASLMRRVAARIRSLR